MKLMPWHYNEIFFQIICHSLNNWVCFANLLSWLYMDKHRISVSLGWKKHNTIFEEIKSVLRWKYFIGDRRCFVTLCIPMSSHPPICFEQSLVVMVLTVGSYIPYLATSCSWDSSVRQSEGSKSTRYIKISGFCVFCDYFILNILSIA